MHRIIAMIGIVVTVAAATPALGAINEAEPTSYDPIETLINGLAGGAPADGLLTAGEGPVVQQFQLLVNFGADPAFYDDGAIEARPVGLDVTGTGLVDLSEPLGANFAETGPIPPLHPGGVTADGVDLAPLFAGWAGFGEAGPVGDTAPVGEGPSMVWGVQLIAPFDTSCANPSSAGRAWQSQSIVSGNAPWTAAGLDDAFLGPPGSHGALADGVLGRSIELTCQGGQPVLMGLRQNPDLDRVRTFGPLDIHAFVRDDWVVFVTEARHVADGVAEPVFFGSDETGTVGLSRTATPVLGLVPNPYDVVTETARFVYDPDTIELIAASPSRDEAPQDQNLLYTGDSRTVTAGISCGTGIRIMHAVSATTFDWFWGTQTSTWRSVERNGDTITTSTTYLDGSSDTITIDTNTGAFTAELRQAPGSDEPDCRIEGTVTWDGEAAGGATGDDPEPSTADDPAATTDDSTAAPATAPDTTDAGEGGGGFPVLPVAIVLGAGVAVGGYITITRRKTIAKPADYSGAGDLLVEAATGLATTADDTAPTESAWTALESRELHLQDDIKARHEEVVRAWTTWHGRFKRAMLRWAEASHRTWNGAGAALDNQRNYQQTQIAAEAAEMAWALINLGKGLCAIGRGALGWWRARKVGELDVLRHLRDLARDNISADPELAGLFQRLGTKGQGSARRLEELGIYAHEIGMKPDDFNSILRHHYDEIRDVAGSEMTDTRLVSELIERALPQLARAKGLTEAPMEVVNLTTEMANVLKTMANRGELSDEMVGSIQRFVKAADDNPFFFDELDSMYTRLNLGVDDAAERIGRGDHELVGEVADLVSGNTLQNLRNLYDSAKTVGTDPTALKESLRTAWQARIGPTQASALRISEGQASLWHRLPAESVKVSDAALEAAEEAVPDHVATTTGDLGNVTDHMAQFDITTDAYVFSTDSYLVETLECIFSPIEQLASQRASSGALDATEQIFADHADDLSEMAQAHTEMRNALEGLDQSIDHGADLLGMIQDLRGVQDEMRDLFDGATPAWRAQNQARFDAKMAHLDQKIDAIGELAAAMRKLNADLWEHIKRLRDHEQSHDGDRRSGLEWIDASVMADITRTAFTLEGFNGAFLSN